jgi:hypothetical protein
MYKQTVLLECSDETPKPEFTFATSATVDVARVYLMTEGDASLEAKIKLIRAIDGLEMDYDVFMPQSYQTYTLLDIPDVPVRDGDKFVCSVNEVGCRCTFSIECMADASIFPPPPEPAPEEPAEEPQLLE